MLHLQSGSLSNNSFGINTTRLISYFSRYVNIQVKNFAQSDRFDYIFSFHLFFTIVLILFFNFKGMIGLKHFFSHGRIWICNWKILDEKKRNLKFDSVLLFLGYNWNNLSWLSSEGQKYEVSSARNFISPGRYNTAQKTYAKARSEVALSTHPVHFSDRR